MKYSHLAKCGEGAARENKQCLTWTIASKANVKTERQLVG